MAVVVAVAVVVVVVVVVMVALIGWASAVARVDAPGYHETDQT